MQSKTDCKMIADYADYADKHWASMLRDFHTHYSQRYLITVMAIRTTFFRHQYRNDPKPIPRVIWCVSETVCVL